MAKSSFMILVCFNGDEMVNLSKLIAVWLKMLSDQIVSRVSPGIGVHISHSILANDANGYMPFSGFLASSHYRLRIFRKPSRFFAISHAGFAQSLKDCPSRSVYQLCEP
jgi:hypothetical protein